MYENFLLLLAMKLIRINKELEMRTRNSSMLAIFSSNCARLLGTCLRQHKMSTQLEDAKRKYARNMGEYSMARSVLENQLSQLSMQQQHVPAKQQQQLSDAPHAHSEIHSDIQSIAVNDVDTSIHASNSKSMRLKSPLTLTGKRDKSSRVVETKAEPLRAPPSVSKQATSRSAAASQLQIEGEGDGDDAEIKSGEDGGINATVGAHNEINRTIEPEMPLFAQENYQKMVSALTKLYKLEREIEHLQGGLPKTYMDCTISALEWIVVANYRPMNLWEKVFGSKSLIGEGEEGVVGVLSSLWVMYNLWPVHHT
jgi:hypothetical protein